MALRTNAEFAALLEHVEGLPAVLNYFLNRQTAEILCERSLMDVELMKQKFENNEEDEAEEENVAHEQAQIEWQRRRDDPFSDVEFSTMLKCVHIAYTLSHDATVLVSSFVREVLNAICENLELDDTAKNEILVEEIQKITSSLFTGKLMEGVELLGNESLLRYELKETEVTSMTLKFCYLNNDKHPSGTRPMKQIAVKPTIKFQTIFEHISKKFRIQANGIVFLYRNQEIPSEAIPLHYFIPEGKTIYIVTQKWWDFRRRDEARRGMLTCVRSNEHAIKHLKENAKSKLASKLEKDAKSMKNSSSGVSRNDKKTGTITPRGSVRAGRHREDALHASRLESNIPSPSKRKMKSSSPYKQNAISPLKHRAMASPGKIVPPEEKFTATFLHETNIALSRLEQSALLFRDLHTQLQTTRDQILEQQRFDPNIHYKLLSQKYGKLYRTFHVRSLDIESTTFASNKAAQKIIHHLSLWGKVECAAKENAYMPVAPTRKVTGYRIKPSLPHVNYKPEKSQHEPALPPIQAYSIDIDSDDLIDIGNTPHDSTKSIYSPVLAPSSSSKLTLLRKNSLSKEKLRAAPSREPSSPSILLDTDKPPSPKELQTTVNTMSNGASSESTMDNPTTAIESLSTTAAESLSTTAADAVPIDTEEPSIKNTEMDDIPPIQVQDEASDLILSTPEPNADQVQLPPESASLASPTPKVNLPQNTMDENVEYNTPDEVNSTIEKPNAG